MGPVVNRPSQDKPYFQLPPFVTFVTMKLNDWVG